MDVDHRPHQGSDHGAALNVPAWAAGAPGGGPGGLPCLRSLPERKISGSPLPLIHCHPLTRSVVLLREGSEENYSIIIIQLLVYVCH